MYYINNKGKTFWWDSALEWLLEDDPQLAKRLMKEGRLIRYLDERPGRGAGDVAAYARGPVAEDVFVEHLLSIMPPHARDSSGKRVDSQFCRTGEHDEFSALIGEVLRDSDKNSRNAV